MKIVQIKDYNSLSVDASDWNPVGEFAVIPNWLDVSGEAIAVLRKHGSNSLSAGGLEIRLFCDEDPAVAIREAEAEIAADGVAEDDEAWWKTI